MENGAAVQILVMIMKIGSFFLEKNLIDLKKYPEQFASDELKCTGGKPITNFF